MICIWLRYRNYRYFIFQFYISRSSHVHPAPAFYGACILYIWYGVTFLTTTLIIYICSTSIHLHLYPPHLPTPPCVVKCYIERLERCTAVEVMLSPYTYVWLRWRWGVWYTRYLSFTIRMRRYRREGYCVCAQRHWLLLNTRLLWEEGLFLRRTYTRVLLKSYVLHFKVGSLVRYIYLSIQIHICMHVPTNIERSWTYTLSLPGYTCRYSRLNCTKADSLY